jgi:two-component system response regulator RegX3
MGMARILIAESNDPIRWSLASLLKLEGHEVDQASDGCQALDHFADHPSDLVLMDVYMPNLDGLETCRRLRIDSDVPILMLSATREASLQEMAFHSGANAFLPKPLEPEGLLTWVRTLSSAQINGDYN